MKIGFTTYDSVHINAHFGSASQIDLYEANARGFTFLETLKFQGNLQEDGNEDKLTPKVRALQDCSIVYVLAIGGSAVRRLICHNIIPVKADAETANIRDVLAELVTILNNSPPPPWLRKALSKSQPVPASDRSASRSEGRFEKGRFDSQFEDNRFEDNFETIEEEITV